MNEDEEGVEVGLMVVNGEEALTRQADRRVEFFD